MTVFCCLLLAFTRKLLKVCSNIFTFFQLRQNDTELQKVKEAIENFSKMM